jgi:hypothetical protein
MDGIKDILLLGGLLLQSMRCILILSVTDSWSDLSMSLGYCKCPLRLGSELLPNRSRSIRRSSTKGYRTHHIQLDVPTSPTTVSHHLWCLHFVCCVEKARDVTNLPPSHVPFWHGAKNAPRVDGTIAKVVPKRIDLKLPATTSREW